MTEVVPRVYIGGVKAARDMKTIRERGITHVLTVHRDAFDDYFPATVKASKHVEATDEAETDLLSRLPECIDFVVRGVAAGGILIHCHAGISRSATVLMAYVMATEQLDCPSAFRRIKSIYRPAKPNAGFVAQLKLFWSMGCRLDPENPEYRLYRLRHLTEGVTAAAAARLDTASSSTAGTSGRAHGVVGADPSMEPVPGHMDIRCRKCRRLLARDTQLLYHSPGQGQLSFTWHRRDGPSSTTNSTPTTTTTTPTTTTTTKTTTTAAATAATAAAVAAVAAVTSSSSCSSLFLEPISWMSEVMDGSLAGKITCPKCSGRLGSFDWAGTQCSCGAWITPAFQIPKRRVDITPRRSTITTTTTTAAAAAATTTAVSTTITGTTAVDAGPTSRRPVMRRPVVKTDSIATAAAEVDGSSSGDGGKDLLGAVAKLKV